MREKAKYSPRAKEHLESVERLMESHTYIEAEAAAPLRTKDFCPDAKICAEKWGRYDGFESKQDHMRPYPSDVLLARVS
eukprot:scaffold2621_cov31-Tisochrysis_lutea.AAC.9